jgi:hypothetical protein
MAAISSAGGWAEVAERLRSELELLRPPGELVSVGVDASGLPCFRVRLDPSVRAEGRALVRRYEDRAAEVCESCGGAGTVHAGAVISIRCEEC